MNWLSDCSIIYSSLPLMLRSCLTRRTPGKVMWQVVAPSAPSPPSPGSSESDSSGHLTVQACRALWGEAGHVRIHKRTCRQLTVEGGCWKKDYRPSWGLAGAASPAPPVPLGPVATWGCLGASPESRPVGQAPLHWRLSTTHGHFSLPAVKR